MVVARRLFVGDHVHCLHVLHVGVVHDLGNVPRGDRFEHPSPEWARPNCHRLRQHEGEPASKNGVKAPAEERTRVHLD
jgi:hypothetical protein